MLKRILAMAVVAGLALSFASWAADAPKDQYVGVNKCKMCHMKEYKAWAETKHAKAFASLAAATPEQIKKMNELLKTDVKDHPEKSESCVGCHVTGYKDPTGYPQADSTKSAALAMVGCEDCHGPGSKHMAVPMSDKAGRKASITHPTAETCAKCHGTVTPKFDFAVMSKKVHPVAAAAPAK